MTSSMRPDGGLFDDLLRGMTFEFFGSGRHRMTVEQLLERPEAVLLDVRSAEETRTLALPLGLDVTALEIPTHEIPDRLDEIPADRPVAVFCSAGVRAAMVYAYLRTRGFDGVRVLVGGFPALTEQAKPGKIYARLQKREATA